MPSSLHPQRSNPLHLPTRPTTTWTSVNTSETMPGVMSPLGWGFWIGPGERGTRGSFCDLGVLRSDEVLLPDAPDDRASTILLGRFVANVDTFRAFADRIPGSAGDDFERQIFGSAREGAGNDRTRRHWPAIAVKAPAAVVRLPARIERTAKETHDWWRTAVTAPQGDGRAQLRRAGEMTEAAMRVHVLATFVAQGLFSALEDLATSAGRPGAHLELSKGYGDMEETDLVHRLWRVAHRGDPVEDFLEVYGFHGPEEGEISVRSWREDPSLVDRMVAAYRRDPGQRDPKENEQRQVADRERAEASILGALGRADRVRARLLMRMARRYIPLREAGKAALHKGFDGGRAAARARGAELVADGVIPEVDDVFHLTLDEVLGRLPDDPAAAIAHRRALREEYRAVDVPRHWVGEPVPVPLTGADDGDRVQEVRGTGASHGVAEGRVRICHSADECDVLEHGEVLVCRATNPGWASAFPLVVGMVIDVGSPGSHAAIIAREMGLPCVIGTDRGTALLRTGDLVRVDGSSGVVEVLEPAAATPDTGIGRVADDAADVDGGAPVDDSGGPHVTGTATGDTAGVADTAAGPGDAHELLVLRLVALKGRVTAEVVADVLALDRAVVESTLGAGLEAGTVKRVRDAVRLTPKGREHSATLLERERDAADADRLEALYERFHVPNDQLKDLMTRWQTRDGEANDHTDGVYDASVADELAAFHDAQRPLVAGLGDVSRLLASYGRRLDAAAELVATGDHSFVAAPLADSYHTAWFELHDDLILLLGRTRADEALAGRAV